MSKNKRGTVFGLHDFASNIGNIIGPVFGGFLWDIYYKLPFILSIVTEAVLAFLYPIAITLIRKSFDQREHNQQINEIEKFIDST